MKRSIVFAIGVAVLGLGLVGAPALAASHEEKAEAAAEGSGGEKPEARPAAESAPSEGSGGEKPAADDKKAPAEAPREGS